MTNKPHIRRSTTRRISRRSVLHGGVTAGASLAMGNLPALQQRSLHAAQATPITSRPSESEWIAYGRDPGGMRHSPLTQITRQNVETLAVAWTYHTGELASYEGTALAESAAFEATPLMVDGALYFSTPSNRVIALDAATGAERWVFDPGVDLTRDYSEVTSRGVSTWVDPDKSPADPGYRRLFLGTLDGRLLALDADSGQPSTGFGQQGAVDLTAAVNLLRSRQLPGHLAASHRRRSGRRRLGHRRQPRRGVGARYRPRLSSAGAARCAGAGIPSRAELRRPRATTPGTAPSPTRPAAPMPGRRSRPTPSATWSSSPPRRPSPDYYGGERLGQNLYANCVVALRASTGEHGLALPDRPPRHLGLRRADATGADRRRTAMAKPSRRLPWAPSRATSSSSTARPASRSPRSRSGRCRRRTSPARRPGRRNPSRRNCHSSACVS